MVQSPLRLPRAVLSSTFFKPQAPSPKQVSLSSSATYLLWKKSPSSLQPLLPMLAHFTVEKRRRKKEKRIGQEYEARFSDRGMWRSSTASLEEGISCVSLEKQLLRSPGQFQQLQVVTKQAVCYCVHVPVLPTHKICKDKAKKFPPKYKLHCDKCFPPLAQHS